MIDPRATHHARLLLASYAGRSVGLVVKPRDDSRVGGWKRRIGEAVVAEVDAALERHYRFWAKAFVREAMEPGREYDTGQLRALTGVNRKQVKVALRQLRDEGVVECDARSGAWRLA